MVPSLKKRLEADGKKQNLQRLKKWRETFYPWDAETLDHYIREFGKDKGAFEIGFR